MTDRRRRAAQADPSHEDNPFAAPPEGRPDRPWQARRPEDEGSPGDEPSGDRSRGEGGEGNGGGRSRWGSQWSPRQPGRHDGGFGGPKRPEQGGNGDGNGGGRRPGRLRWDPTDPKQRHARYALHGGIWGLFFALFGLTEIALLLGALSVYWGISALRGSGPAGDDSAPTAHATAEDVAGTGRKSGDDGEQPAGAARPASVDVAVSPAQAAKARRAAAIGGLVAGVLTLLGVAGNFTQRMVYEDYYTCRQDALTQSARELCKDLPEDEVPPWLTMTSQQQGE